MEDTCVVISGKLQQIYVNELKETYKNFSNKIISTWENEDINLINTLKNNGFIIVLSPSIDLKNYNQHTSALVQSITIKAGVEKAQELNYKFIIRMRTDVSCNDFNLFCNLIYSKYKEKITVLCGVLHYFLDLMVAGTTEEMIKFFKNIPSDTDDRGPEIYWMEEYTHKGISLDEFKTKVNFCLQNVKNKGITMKWISKNIEIINNYCSKPFIVSDYSW